MILNSIAFKLRLNCLHPTKDGWFKENELKGRARLGHRFDVSFRHMTPVLELEPLQELLPDSLITTIMRDPVTKFNSMFNFVQTTRAHYGTAMNFVNAVKEGKASVKEKNDLCNNLAYSISGSQISLADLNYQESKDYAEKMIADFESKDVFVMITERMNESLVVMCERMGWDCYSGALSFKNTVERQNKQAGTVKCNDEECKKGIKSVNEVDWMLYEYYKEKLDAIIKTIPDFETKLKKLGENMEKSAANAQKYPVNCFERINPDRPEFEAIHTCQGRT
ncbi:hypothetical protein TrVE_jg9553 [Triparma verrucosa]|uniref:Uncharacterized protein n=1 Tax=Triparma verrucosa TaxID=1606542 RepID=A0A9W7C214_9STRA|nr:hypothetical protein TrVE_jg9553 [Triparma verrucosa]